jgi:lipoic acid synthetase
LAPLASYPRSYKILEHARKRDAVTKTGLMLGLGETRAEVEEVLRELAGLGVDIVTLGQYSRRASNTWRSSATSTPRSSGLRR